MDPLYSLPHDVLIYEVFQNLHPQDIVKIPTLARKYNKIERVTVLTKYFMCKTCPKLQTYSNRDKLINICSGHDDIHDPLDVSLVTSMICHNRFDLIQTEQVREFCRQVPDSSWLMCLCCSACNNSSLEMIDVIIDICLEANMNVNYGLIRFILQFIEKSPEISYLILSKLNVDKYTKINLQLICKYCTVSQTHNANLLKRKIEELISM